VHRLVKGVTLRVLADPTDRRSRLRSAVVRLGRVAAVRRLSLHRGERLRRSDRQLLARCKGRAPRLRSGPRCGVSSQLCDDGSCALK